MTLALWDQPYVDEDVAVLLSLAFGLQADETTVSPIPEHWSDWLRLFFPTNTRHPFAPHHAECYEWADAVEPGVRSVPFVEILARGGGKSSMAEMIAVYWAARRARKYLWYISRTQDQADDHVASIGTLLTNDMIEQHYPLIAERRVNKFGTKRGWNRNRLWTADGFVIDALGLDTAARGVKLDEQRPDGMILDDLDDQTDGPRIVDKNVKILTRRILPAGTDDLAVLAIQNLIQDQGIFARLAGIADERADFLADRIVVGPIPALIDPAYEERDGLTYVIAGTPTWAGQDLEACQRIINRDGPSSFKVECQHTVDTFEGALFSNVTFQHCRPDQVPDLVRIAVWVDPAVTETDKSDSHGVQADGIDAKKRLYRLRSWEGITSPRESLRRALLWAVELGASSVGVETDQGGDTWKSVYREAWQSLVDEGLVPKTAKRPRFKSAKAGSGHGPKVERAQRMLADYERANITHVLGYHAVLEKSLQRFPVREPHDLTDASYWSWFDLRGKHLRGILARSLNGRKSPPPLTLTDTPPFATPEQRVLTPMQTNASERAREQFEANDRTPRRQAGIGGTRRRAW